MKLKLEKVFNTRKRMFGFSFSLFHKDYKLKYMQGFSNRTSDGLYCVFLEYDHMLLDFVRDELKRLQEAFELSDFLIVESSENSYHCYCFDKVTFEEYRHIQYQTSIDNKWRDFPVSIGTRNWVLRYTAKDKTSLRIMEILSSPYNGREKSRIHLRAVEARFKFKLNHTEEDESVKMYVGGYYI